MLPLPLFAIRSSDGKDAFPLLPVGLCFRGISQRRRTGSPQNPHLRRGEVKFQPLLNFHPALQKTLMNVEGAVQNLGSLSSTRFDCNLGVLAHAVLDDSKRQAQLLHFSNTVHSRRLWRFRSVQKTSITVTWRSLGYTSFSIHGDKRIYSVPLFQLWINPFVGHYSCNSKDDHL